jgi:acylphosphatase
VTGRVQGVFYRATAKDVAEALELKGFVRNEPDQTVYIEVEGESSNVNQFVDWCSQGPPRAVVNDVQVNEGTVQGYPDFVVKRG